MANKKEMLKQLADYFAEKGKFLSAAEYKAAEDVPMRFVIAKRPFGSWSRVASMIKTNFPEHLVFRFENLPNFQKLAGMALENDSAVSLKLPRKL